MSTSNETRLALTFFSPSLPLQYIKTTFRPGGVQVRKSMTTRIRGVVSEGVRKMNFFLNFVRKMKSVIFCVLISIDILEHHFSYLLVIGLTDGPHIQTSTLISEQWNLSDRQVGAWTQLMNNTNWQLTLMIRPCHCEVSGPKSLEGFKLYIRSILSDCIPQPPLLEFYKKY